MQEQLERRKQLLEDEFNGLNKEREKLIADRRNIDQRLSQIQAKQLQLQGSWKEIDELLKEVVPEETH